MAILCAMAALALLHYSNYIESAGSLERERGERERERERKEEQFCCITAAASCCLANAISATLRPISD